MSFTLICMCTYPDLVKNNAFPAQRALTKTDTNTVSCHKTYVDNMVEGNTEVLPIEMNTWTISY